MRKIVNFAWNVTKGGYKWITARKAPIFQPSIKAADAPDKGEFLTDDVPLGGRWESVRYAPLERDTGLFRTFVSTPPTKEGIQTFASRYGPLGGDLTVHIILPNNKSGNGETLSAWREEIIAMRQAVALWDMVHNNDEQSLKKHVQWREGGVHYDSHPHLPEMESLPDDMHIRSWIAHETDPDLLERFHRGDVVHPALHYLQGVVNQRLAGRVSPRLLWDRHQIRLGLYLYPGSLIGALWLQFAQAISGEKDYRECAQCRKWLEVSPNVARKNKLFCSNACRSQAYRGRQEEARQLHAKRVPLKEIAKRLGTDSTTAKGWIKKRKEV